MTATNTSTAYRYGFRVVGDCRQPRRLVDAGAALAAHAACDERAELESECYLSAFQFAGDFKDHLSATGSTAGFAAPCWSPFIWFDIDADGDLDRAKTDAGRIATTIAEQLDIDDGDLLAFFSGAKGFHVGIPTTIWMPAPGPDFHKTARQFAELIADFVKTRIDTAIYDRVRCFRAPNSRHPKTGLHKRRLSIDELLHLRTDAILALAERPEPFDLPTPTYRSQRAADMWTAATLHMERAARAHAERRANGNGRVQLNRPTLDFIRDGAPNGERQKRLYSAAANLAEHGAALPLCVALLEETALDCGLPPKEVERTIRCGCQSAQSFIRDVVKAFGATVIDVESPAAADRAKGGVSP